MNGIFRYVFELIFTWFPVNTDFFWETKNILKELRGESVAAISYLVIVL